MADIAAPKTFALTTPIPYGDKTLDALTLRAPCAGDLRGIRLSRLEEVDTDTVLSLVPRIATPHVVAAQLDALSPHDTLRLAAEVVGFFAPPADPNTPSPTMPATPGES